MSALFFCYWSHSQEYRALAEACAASFKKFDVDVIVEELPTTSNWMKNCMARAAALKLRADFNPNDTIVLLDADLTCVGDPVILKTFGAIDGDIAVHDKGANISPSIRYCPGIMAFAPTAHGRECLSRWASLCVEDARPREWIREQVYLCETIEKGRKEGMKVFPLPMEYNVVRNGVGCAKPVIFHFAASRELRDKVGGTL